MCYTKSLQLQLQIVIYEIVLATFLVNGYPGVGGEFGLAGGENVEAAPPHKLPALAQVPHLGTRSCFEFFRTDDLLKLLLKTVSGEPQCTTLSLIGQNY